MEENVALDSAKQKDFLKSVKGIKKLLKKKVKKDDSVKAGTQKNETKETVIFKKRDNRGLVYLSHIPHGFYEQQMTEYFKQFGVVTNVRVIRSRRTGASKGFAFVEFKDTEVAQVVAETMNNYLMGKRLIKAAYIPPHKQRRHALRKKWNSQNNPSTEERLKYIKMHNASKTVDQDLRMGQKMIYNLSKTKKKLSHLGIDYDFFEPVDVPEALKDWVDNIALSNNKPKKQVKTDVKPVDAIKIEQDDISVKKTEKNKKKKVKGKDSETLNSDFREYSKTNKHLLKNDNGNINDENPEKERDNKLKKTGVKAPENFVSLKEADYSDDINFDSADCEKMMENDNMLLDSENTETENEDVERDESDLPEGAIQQSKRIKGNAIPSLHKRKAKFLSGIETKLDKGSAPGQAVKRKYVHDSPVKDKKVKFEKQRNKKPVSKVIKKRI